jgi:uncharacterized protein (TIGR02996 family)
MPALEQLHAEVLRHPDSDEARIAYADAIAASDAPRAELIRVQLRLIRSLRANGPLLDRSGGYDRERQLLDRHKDAWIKPLSGVPGVQWVGLMRGFPESVRMRARDFLDQGARLLALAPVRHLSLEEARPHARELFESPLLAPIRTLSLRKQQLGDAEARLLADSAHVRGLRWLDLAANAIGQPGLEALAASPNLPELRVLEFGDNAVPDPTPQVGETDIDSGEVLRLEITPVARALEEKFGRRAWLSSPIHSATYPPGREQF